MNFKKISCKSGLFFAILIILFYYCICVVQETYTRPFFLYNYIIILTSALMLFLFGVDMLRSKLDIINVFLLGFICISVVPTFFFYSNKGIIIQTARIADMLLWLGTFHMARKYGTDKLLPLFLVMVIAHFILWFPVMEYHEKYGTPLITCSYYSIYLIPFVLMVKNKGLKWTFIILCLIPVLLSEKRTGFLVAVIGIICYVFLNLKLKNKNSGERIIRLAFTFILLTIILFYIIDALELRIFDRIENIKEDQGSGRVDVWLTTWDMIWNSSGWEILFGHGYNAVVFHSPLHFSAHNEFLELLYDHGLFGFVFYCGFLYQITSRAIKYYKQGRHNSEIFLTSVIMYYVFSMTSHLLLFPTYFIYLCLFWGLYVGKQEKENKLLGVLK